MQRHAAFETKPRVVTRGDYRRLYLEATQPPSVSKKTHIHPFFFRLQSSTQVRVCATVGEMKCLCSEVAAQVSPGKTQEQQSGRMKGHQKNMCMKASFLLLQTNV